jgi:drug/metabolite transporter (DMT)-like permease
MQSTLTPSLDSSTQKATRARKLQLLGILSGFTAGAWLGAAEAPTKLVTIGLSPMVVSLIMVVGVFLARWSVPALILGTASVRADVRRAPHLIIWALLAGCLWAVANTMTIFAIRDVGLSIAFPLWNSNSLLGILWGSLFFNELRQAGWRRGLGVLGGALVMCAGAALLAIASSTQATTAHSLRGAWAALGAGVLWGTMYIPYRKAYLTGMNPLSFVTFFTFGELGMMSALAVSYLGVTPLLRELQSARDVLFWLMLGGFIWVIGDLFQQYAAKYVGISRGIPLSNTNQFWGLLWGTLVFGELHGRSHSIYAQVIGGSLLMMAGVAGIAFSSATSSEQTQWKQAAHREGQRYNLESEFVDARMNGRQSDNEERPSRTAIDWLLVAAATAIFVYFGASARLPQIAINWPPALILSAATLTLLLGCGLTLHRTTGFH